uniref:Protein kinase domain-containing protein n=1 Tax=Panagrellus redivivus TaxID=6233 RepID=A0A7E4W9K6_PANRE
MMVYFSTILLILCFVICNVLGKVELKKDHAERVTFDEEDLAIVVDNSLGRSNLLQICFGSSPDTSFPPCLSGYARVSTEVPEHVKVRLIVNRQGQLLKDGAILSTSSAIRFNEDDTLNIMVAMLPDTKTTVTLPNAHIFVPEKPEEEKENKKESKSATIGITVGVVALVILVIGIVAGIGIWLYRRRKSKKEPIDPPEIIVQSVPKAAETPDHTPEKKEKPPTPKTPEQVSKSPQTPIQPPPQPIVPPSKPELMPPAKTVAIAPSPDVASPLPLSPSPKSVEQPPKEVEKATGKNTVSPKATPTVESAEPTKETNAEPPAKQKSKQDSKKSLQVEKTQVSNMPSPPTPKFSDHPFAKSVAKNSVLKEIDNLAYEETANPFTKKINFYKADEVTRFKLRTESIRCYGMRNGKFTKHNNFILRERFTTRPHKVHVWEKNILKATPSNAVAAADALVDRIERELIVFGYRLEHDLTQNSILWGHLNLEDTEISKLYWLLLQVRPDLFKVEQDVQCNEIQTMPIAMLYALILNTKLNKKFREELVTELRTTTVNIIRIAGQNALRLAAFPLNYLVLLHNKDPSKYVQGRPVRETGNIRFQHF